MKSVKFLLVIASLLLASNIGLSQSSKSNSKAVKKTEKIDKELSSEDPALALTDSQKEQIIALHVESMNEVSAFRKENSNEAEVKAKSKELNKAMNNKIRNDIFTEDQANAQKAYRKKMKTEKRNGIAKANKFSKKSKKEKAMNRAVVITIAEADEIYAAATDKQKARAEKATEKLNAKISASDESLALSDDQRKQIIALNLKPIFEAAKMKKEGLSKKEIKLKNKEEVKSNRRLIKSILTKEQKNAQKKKK